jgi:hypothetical protein
MIWGDVFGTDNGSAEVNYAQFYVGTESGYRHETDPTGRTYKPCP